MFFFFSNENVIASCFVNKQLKRKQEIACIDRWMNIYQLLNEAEYHLKNYGDISIEAVNVLSAEVINTL